VNDFIERATVVELPAKGEYFGVELVVGWKVESARWTSAAISSRTA
jgi:hypothetical protein